MWGSWNLPLVSVAIKMKAEHFWVAHYYWMANEYFQNNTFHAFCLAWLDNEYNSKFIVVSLYYLLCYHIQ